MDIVNRTTALARGLSLLLHHHGARVPVLDALCLQLHHYLDSSLDEMVWLKRAKWTLAYPLAKYLRNELPPQPDVPFVPSGTLKRWFKPRLAVFNRKNTHLWYSWFQGKRCSLPASDAFVKKTYDDHLKSLTSPDMGDESVIEEIFTDRTFKSVLDSLRSEVADKVSERFEDGRASGSACFEQTRATGGQHYELLRLVDINPTGSEICAMKFFPRVYTKNGCLTNQVLEARAPFGGDGWRDLVRQASRLDFSVPAKCTIQAVLEPFKVRVISKGEALPYYSVRPLQKVLHTAMRRMSCFRLIGRPFSPTDVLDMASSSHMDDEWFSIDYSAATDGLSWKYSGRILRYLIQDLSPLQQQQALKVLGPHDLFYPDDQSDEGKVYRGLQKNGQLMGSILSFPILCLANLGVYLLNMAGRQWGLEDEERLNRVLVNGDDMVYCAHPDLWESHIRMGKAVGLNMSVGKAYHHPEYLNINSTSVLLDLRASNTQRSRTPWKVDYLNTGLFYGMHKVQGQDEIRSDVSTCDAGEEYAAAHMGADPSNGLVNNLNTILAGALPGRQSDLLREFIVVHNAELRKECTCIIERKGKRFERTRNIFLPITLGGMGVVPPPDWKFRLTLGDRLIASSVLMSKPLISMSVRPLPGYDVDSFDLVSINSWSKPARLKDPYLEVVAAEFEMPSYRRTLREYWLYGEAVPYSLTKGCVIC